MAGGAPQTIRIFLKHHTNPTLAPRVVICEDYPDQRTGMIQKGCGATVLRYATYPRGKGMRFDSEPLVIEDSETNMGDGSTVATVQTENIHFATCPARRQVTQADLPDSKVAAAGE